MYRRAYAATLGLRPWNSWESIFEGAFEEADSMQE